MPRFCKRRYAKGCKSDRSFQELSNEYLVLKIRVDTAENEPLTIHLISKPWDLIFTEPPPLRTSGALSSSLQMSNLRDLIMFFTEPPRDSATPLSKDSVLQRLNKKSPCEGRRGRGGGDSAKIGPRILEVKRTLRGSFSAVSKPQFASKS